MKVFMYVDSFATLGSSPEQEYEEIEAKFKEWLPDKQIIFKRDVVFFNTQAF